MEEFLNSEKFYKMAKEYNEKYNSISALNIKKLDMEKVESVLKNICKLIYLVKKGFSRNRKFSGVLDKFGELDEKVCGFEEKIGCKIERDFSKEKGLYIHNKTFIFIIFDIIKDIFDIVFEKNSGEIKELFDCLIEALSLFYKVI